MCLLVGWGFGAGYEIAYVLGAAQLTAGAVLLLRSPFRSPGRP
ncbi:hypothetical protein [Streptomyces sp. ISL-1]|nr:hypothetical protein [Streptomyces sp. ISL-1]